MNKINIIDYYDLIEIVEKNNNPFSRENRKAKIKINYGEGTYSWYNLGNGIATSCSEYKLNQNLCIKLSSDVSGAALIFNLDETFTQIFQNREKFVFKKNHFIIGFSSNTFSVNNQVKKHKKYKTLTIGIKEELFLKLVKNYDFLKDKMNEANKRDFSIIEGGEIDYLQHEFLLEFEQMQKNKDSLNVLSIESNVIKLVHYSIEKILKNIVLKDNLDKSKIDSLNRAKEIIQKDYYKNLSIKEIAYKSAINECYLKKDFKIYYGMTIYEMIKKERMLAAKNLLNENLSIKEVCHKIGYKHRGNFSKLFTDYFGISPSFYKKQLFK